MQQTTTPSQQRKSVGCPPRLHPSLVGLPLSPAALKGRTSVSEQSAQPCVLLFSPRSKAPGVVSSACGPAVFAGVLRMRRVEEDNWGKQTPTSEYSTRRTGKPSNGGMDTASSAPAHTCEVSMADMIDNGFNGNRSMLHNRQQRGTISHCQKQSSAVAPVGTAQSFGNRLTQ